jgi:hypothetical protein
MSKAERNEVVTVNDTKITRGQIHEIYREYATLMVRIATGRVQESTRRRAMFLEGAVKVLQAAGV